MGKYFRSVTEVCRLGNSRQRLALYWHDIISRSAAEMFIEHEISVDLLVGESKTKTLMQNATYAIDSTPAAVMLVNCVLYPRDKSYLNCKSNNLCLELGPKAEEREDFGAIVTPHLKVGGGAEVYLAPLLQFSFDMNFSHKV